MIKEVSVDGMLFSLTVDKDLVEDEVYVSANVKHIDNFNQRYWHSLGARLLTKDD